jgi:hypothetical protein
VQVFKGEPESALAALANGDSTAGSPVAGNPTVFRHIKATLDLGDSEPYAVSLVAELKDVLHRGCSVLEAPGGGERFDYSSCVQLRLMQDLDTSKIETLVLHADADKAQCVNLYEIPVVGSTSRVQACFRLQSDATHTQLVRVERKTPTFLCGVLGTDAANGEMMRGWGVRSCFLLLTILPGNCL